METAAKVIGFVLGLVIGTLTGGLVIWLIWDVCINYLFDTPQIGYMYSCLISLVLGFLLKILRKS